MKYFLFNLRALITFGFTIFLAKMGNAAIAIFLNVPLLTTAGHSNLIHSFDKES